MERKLAGKLVLLFVLLCLLGPIQSEGRPPELIAVDYTEELSNWSTKIDSSLRQAGLKKTAVITSEQKPKVVRRANYQFSWQYNFRKLEVPLFGPEGKLLSACKHRIIAAFRANFPVVKAAWTKQKKQTLTLKLGLEPHSDFTLISYKLQFKQRLPRAKMAIVIDDFGFHRAGTNKLLSIERPLTVSVLPFRPRTQLDAKLAQQAGYELLLHQPLEPLDSRANPGAGAIYTDMKTEKIKEVLRRNLSNLPSVVGINNHMGSQATTNPRVMDAIMDVLKARELFYVDSSTAPHSIGLEIAQENKVPAAVNHLFIDNISKKEKIKNMILRLGERALKRGELTVIGHVKMSTALALQKAVPQLEKMGIKLVYVSDLVE